MKKEYWKTLEELKGNVTETPQEAGSSTPLEILANDQNATSSSRRDFLKWCGISFVSATVLSACENPVKKAIPYLNQPEEVTPGKALWYAGTYQQGNEYCPILVKNRDGRPIKIEGNTSSSITKGGTNARVQASILSLYDNGARYHHPAKNAQRINWQEADNDIKVRLQAFSDEGKRMAIVCPTLLSPATKELMQELSTFYPGLEVITWDAISYDAIRQAHLTTFGADVFPDYQFDKAKLIVSFGADFLGTWVAPTIFSHQYSSMRKISREKPNMSRHIQFESSFSITGANADERIPVKPSEEIRILMALHDAVAEATGNRMLGAPTVEYDVRNLAGEILEHRGEALIVCGHNNEASQSLVNAINSMAGSYGRTISTGNPLTTGQGSDSKFENFVSDLQQGQYAAVMFYGTNPLYHHHNPKAIAEGIDKTPLTISFACSRDETAEACDYVLPDNHYLESWNDAMFKQGHYSLSQPVIHPLFNTRQVQDTFLVWLKGEASYHEYLKSYWQEKLFLMQDLHGNPDVFWTHSLQEGVFEQHSTSPQPMHSLNQASLPGAMQRLKEVINKAATTEFIAYPHLALADGTNANNPWLQEMPDPVSSVTWDNYAAVSPATAKAKNLIDGDIISINEKLELPVLIQPGLANDSVAIALGYGRKKAGKAGDFVGDNAFALTRWDGTDRWLSGPVDTWQKTGSGHQFARTQMHFSMEGRAIVRESTLDKYRKDPAAGNEIRAYHKKHELTLYPETHYDGHHWALMVDLNACTGCSTCVIACQSENNVPVVGKDEVRRRRIMHWLRIDRYYNGDMTNPEVVFQPLMCMHCDHAPCENVCPVAATTHSREGINQMTYNRCVGTKYCINNCPYKVRRFNWFAYAQNKAFDYHMNSDFGRMVLNPDVTVRERGVVEKCSFCIQRINEAKATAKNERRQLRDGEVVTACAQACPSNALVFGDLNDKSSRVAELIKDPRNYHLLEELHTLPSIGYLTKIRNKKTT
jgi:MoCo/4Fe-4S cofactor protein with predicted Tat translocation signal